MKLLKFETFKMSKKKLKLLKKLGSIRRIIFLITRITKSTGFERKNLFQTNLIFTFRKVKKEF